MPPTWRIIGAIKGSVTVNGTPVMGAIVVAQDAVSSNDFTGTLTWTNGNYAMYAIPPGTYRLRVCPLDPAATRSIDSLCTGPDISPVYNNAFTSFLPTTNQSVTVAANATNTVNFAVISNAQPFRITNIRMPTANAGSYSWGALPAAMTVGQSNYTIGVASSNLPTSGASFTITGDGLTLGAPTFNANLVGLRPEFHLDEHQHCQQRHARSSHVHRTTGHECRLRQRLSENPPGGLGLQF